MLRSAGAGLLTGLLISALFLLPQELKKRVQAEEARIHQSHLTASCGEAFDSFAREEVSLRVLLDEKPQEGMSVAADRGFWEVPKEGELSLPLAPNPYTFVGIFENRRLASFREVEAGGANQWVLDIGRTPSAPEMRIANLREGEGATVDLDIHGATELKADNLPDEMRIREQEGGYVLEVAPERLRRSFHCVHLRAENEDGQAFSYIGFREEEKGEKIPIYTAEDLSRIREDLAGSYQLMNDIDMSGIDDWEPIGTENYPFTGSFDGGGYEIRGFHAPKKVEIPNFGFFGSVRNACLRGMVFRDPILEPQVPERSLGIVSFTAVISSMVRSSLIEDCGVFGGRVSPSDGSCGGLFAGASHSIIRNCFNSAEVYCRMLNRYLPNTGGIVGGIEKSYISCCANEGSVKGNHLSGGICGYANGSDIRRCINSGYVWGSTIVGAVPAGGIIQANDGGSVGYSYFVRGSSGIGAHSSYGLVSVLPLTEEDLRKKEKMPLLGSFEGEEAQWVYAEDAKGPLPASLHRRIKERKGEKNGL